MFGIVRWCPFIYLGLLEQNIISYGKIMRFCVPVMTLTGSGMLLTLRHYIGFLSYAVDVLRYVALNVVNLRCLVVIH